MTAGLMQKKIDLKMCGIKSSEDHIDRNFCETDYCDCMEISLYDFSEDGSCQQRQFGGGPYSKDISRIKELLFHNVKLFHYLKSSILCWGNEYIALGQYHDGSFFYFNLHWINTAESNPGDVYKQQFPTFIKSPRLSGLRAR